MHEEIQGDRHPGNGSQADQLGVAEESGGTVMVCVEESQGFLLQDHKDGIQEFQVFGEIVELIETLARYHQASSPSVFQRYRVWGFERT